jgi:hypothetical protein
MLHMACAGINISSSSRASSSGSRQRTASLAMLQVKACARQHVRALHSWLLPL